MRYLPALLIVSLVACAPAPMRPSQPTKVERQAQTRLAQEREVLQRAQLERAAAERAAAEFRRKQAEERAPRPGKITLAPSIEAQPLESIPEPPRVEPTPASVEPAPAREEALQIAAVQPKPVQRIDPAAFAWQLGDDLRRLHAEAEVQTFYNEQGWVLSLAAGTLFEPGETSLRTEARDTLDRLARVLRHYAARGVVMDGPDQARAQAVKRALTERGIPDDGIAANGAGERIEFLVPARASARAGTPSAN